MFEDSLVESTALLRPKSRWPLMASLAAQALLLAALLGIPLLHPEAIQLGAPRLTSLAAPLPKPVTPPPPPPRVVASTPSASTVIAAPLAPAARPLINIREAIDPVGDPPIAVGPGTMSTSNSANLPAGLNPGPGTAVSVAPAAGSPTAAKPGIPRISNGVTQGLLLAPIRPVYPQIAKATQTQGTVVIQAIISKAGVIESAHVVSGPPMLQSAALEALKDARYRPYLLNGQPTEVETTISIVFRLGS